MPDVLKTLCELIRIDSVNPEWGGPGEAGVADWVAEFFEKEGIEVWRDEVLPGRSNVVARLPGENRNRSVLLEAHMDTVSAKNMEIAPFEPEMKSGKVYGRGSCDVKAGLAAMLHALVEIHRSGETPPVDVILAAVVDEEFAYRGVQKLIEMLSQSTALPEGAVVAEPTELRLIRANKGVLRWRILVRGKAAHSSNPGLGCSAISAMAEIVAELDRHFGELGAGEPHPLVGTATGSIGRIAGGTQVNLVPDRCEIEIDRRLLPGETGPDALAKCGDLVEKLFRDRPEIEVKMEEPYLIDEAMETDASEAVVVHGSEVLRKMGLAGRPAGVSFGCDCSKLSRAGIPSVIFGPGSIDQAHTADECVETDQVKKAVEFYRRFLLEFGKE